MANGSTTYAQVSAHNCKCHDRPYTVCTACGCEFCPEYWARCPRCRRTGAVSPATREAERNECGDSSPRLRGRQVSWRRIVRNRIGFKHEDRFRSYDSQPGMPVRADLWHAVY